MKKAINQRGKMVDIIESVKEDSYFCPICRDGLVRNFGAKSQYFSHEIGKGEGCDLKVELIEKSKDSSLSEDSLNILNNEYYNKSFKDEIIPLSDYKSEDGYYLTQEQKDIIFSEEDKIKVSALAGSAKTSTLYYYAKERPHKKILYLVYNKSMKDEAEKTFGKLNHVDIKTIHGLAYGYVGRFYRNKLTFNYGVVDIIKDLNLNWSSDMELAVKIDKMMKEYMLSNAESFKDMDFFLDESGKTNPERDRIIKKCEELWGLKKDYNNNIKVEHDFYLKLFQLSKTNLGNKYDIICLDEAQDSNMMMLDILTTSNVEGVVIIGDGFQQIYSWRNAINILPKFEGKEYRLSTSFRVSPNIANIANIIVKDISKQDIYMKGFNDTQKIVHSINKYEPYVCLCRTNAYIFSEVFDILHRNRRAKLFFEGGYSSYNFNNIKDAYYFSEGHKVKNPLFNKFKNYYEMINYAKDIEDLELLALDRMVDKYGNNIPRIVDSVKSNTITNKSMADVIFSTIHRSKGQTYTIPVYISDDHFDIKDVFIQEYIMETKEGFNIKNYYEEMCILYVAITRCANEIEFSDKIKEYLLLRHKYLNLISDDNNRNVVI